MRFSSILAIYSLFWALSFFLVLPFRLEQKGDDEDRTHVPGSVESAPARFSFGRTAFWTTIVAAVLFVIYYANYVNGWVPVETFDFVPRSLLEGR